MDDSVLKQIRQLILDSTTVLDDGIEFDTSKAVEKGYSEAEIAVADDLLRNQGAFTTEFLGDILYYFDSSTDLKIFYVAIARIILLIDLNNQKYTHIFEEDLVKEVAAKRVFENYLEYIMTYSVNDAFGDLICRF